MADPTQYSVSIEEMIELVLKKENIHEGRWNAVVNMQVGTGTFGPTPDKMFPGASVSFVQFGIQKVDPDAPVMPGSIMVDAAVVNPKKGSPRTSKKES